MHICVSTETIPNRDSSIMPKRQSKLKLKDRDQSRNDRLTVICAVSPMPRWLRSTWPIAATI
ncbi:hypothetical protein CY34DRAFT_813248 [Suillus luteus UH-Slu-Lm8-n1]|uniref:Uncharacterized protein n=1 Tax=Suillus luteus UH-Slu-Lm8-n1 TaxID=930992 RepID=A0A0D0APR2_9AGAM|nr:hypothetical protein CY34DRAFT_813248 [Suillus luteus UH-Slu-Lm8-n1]